MVSSSAFLDNLNDKLIRLTSFPSSFLSLLPQKCLQTLFSECSRAEIELISRANSSPADKFVQSISIDAASLMKFLQSEKRQKKFNYAHNFSDDINFICRTHIARGASDVSVARFTIIGNLLKRRHS